MTSTIFVLRSEPGLSATAGQARALGMKVVAEPLAEVRPVEWMPPADDSFDALLFGSANALRHGGEALQHWRGRDAYVVGETTAEAACEAGFDVLRTGSGGLQALLDDLPPTVSHTGSNEGKTLRLLRLAGEKRLPLKAPVGVSIQSVTVYRVVHLPIGEALESRLRGGGVALLHSAEAARHFGGECDRLGVDRVGLSIAALSPRIAEAAGDGWRRVASSPTPADGALLELARDMCH